MQVKTPELGIGWEQTVFAILDGKPVTVLQAGTQLGGMSISPALVWQTVRILGPLRAVRSLPYISAQRRVNAPAPDGSYHIGELHTHSGFRNRGLGKAVLEYADTQAREEGCSTMSLVTTVVNPARHLYERQGFRVVETRTDEVYERMTGIPGRNLMVKELA
jgi:ribosomal protein S18 acetylase RimI-like enzyme